MDPEELALSYDKIADQWNSERFDRENGIAAHNRAIAFTKARGSALDIGCGCSGRIIDLLIREGFSVEGLDISSEMIRLAEKGHPGIKFHHSDICTWEFPRKYDFITAWDSIWHLPLESHRPVMSKLVDGLASNGVLIFTTGGLDDAEQMTNSDMGVPVHYSVLGIPATLALVSELGCVCRHLEYDQYPEKHVFLIVQKV